jgi:hypothetical protein
LLRIPPADKPAEGSKMLYRSWKVVALTQDVIRQNQNTMMDDGYDGESLITSRRILIPKRQMRLSSPMMTITCQTVMISCSRIEANEFHIRIFDTCLATDPTSGQRVQIHKPSADLHLVIINSFPPAHPESSFCRRTTNPMSPSLSNLLADAAFTVN